MLKEHRRNKRFRAGEYRLPNTYCSNGGILQWLNGAGYQWWFWVNITIHKRMSYILLRYSTWFNVLFSILRSVMSTRLLSVSGANFCGIRPTSLAQNDTEAAIWLLLQTGELQPSTSICNAESNWPEPPLVVSDPVHSDWLALSIENYPSQAKRRSPLLFSNICSESISIHLPCAVYSVSFFKSHRKFEALQCCEVVVSMTHWRQIRCCLRCKYRISWRWACSCPWMLQEVKVYTFRGSKTKRLPATYCDFFSSMGCFKFPPTCRWPVSFHSHKHTRWHVIHVMIWSRRSYRLHFYSLWSSPAAEKCESVLQNHRRDHSKMG